MIKFRDKLYKYPDGPVGLPFIGCALYVSDMSHLVEWTAKKYGDIVSFRVGAQRICFVHNTDLVKFLWKEKGVTERHYNPFKESQSPFSVLNGKRWELRRKAISASLFRMLNSSFVHDCVNDTLAKYTIPAIEKSIQTGKVWFPRRDLSHLAFNTLFYASCSKKLTMNDPFYKKSISLSAKIFKYFYETMLKVFFPILGFFIGRNNFISANKQMNDLFMEILKQRKSEFDPKTMEPENWIDDLLLKQIENPKVFTDDAIKNDISAMFAAGTDTSSHTMERLLLCLGLFPNLQELVLKEIKTVMERNNVKEGFSVKYFQQMPLFRAYIAEVMRAIELSATRVPRTSYSDVEFSFKGRKYFIPKMTIMFDTVAGYRNYLNNPGKKEEFDLRNYLQGVNEDKEIDLEDPGSYKFVKNDHDMMFGVGKRDCVGQNFARLQIRQILGNLMLKYRFSLPKDYPVRSIEDVKFGEGLALPLKPEVSLLVEKRK